MSYVVALLLVISALLTNLAGSSGNMTTPTAPVRVGVLLVPPTQLLDIGAVDLLYMLTPAYLGGMPLPPSITAGAVPIDISHVAASGAGSLVPCTANVQLRATHGLTDPGARPGDLDVLVIPGPDPRLEIPEEVRAFVRGHFEKEATDVLAICTGTFVAGAAGILDGRRATGGALAAQLAKVAPKAKLEPRRWTHDGNLWTSASITNGLDMMAAYLRHTWPGPAVETVLRTADVAGRPNELGEQ